MYVQYVGKGRKHERTVYYLYWQGPTAWPLNNFQSKIIVHVQVAKPTEIVYTYILI